MTLSIRPFSPKPKWCKVKDWQCGSWMNPSWASYKINNVLGKGKPLQAASRTHIMSSWQRWVMITAKAVTAGGKTSSYGLKLLTIPCWKRKQRPVFPENTRWLAHTLETCQWIELRWLLPQTLAVTKTLTKFGIRKCSLAPESFQFI